MNQAEMIFFAVKIWGAIGGLVALGFLTFGIDQIDEDAQGAYVFRPLLVPGILVLWPLVVWRWAILATGKDHWPKRYRTRRRNHLWVALTMPACIVVILIAGWSARQSWPADIAPVQLSQPAETAQ